MMTKRMRWIETVIDRHVEQLITEASSKPKFDKRYYDKIRDRSYDGKLQALMLSENDLMQRSERLQQMVLRMKGITQSYYLYDSAMYKPLKPLLMEIRAAFDQENKPNATAKPSGPSHASPGIVPLVI